MTFARIQCHIRSGSRSCIAPLHSPDGGAFPQQITDATAELKPTRIGRGGGGNPEPHTLKSAKECGGLGIAHRTSIGAKRQPSTRNHS
jgi:hypothetical protein